MMTGWCTKKLRTTAAFKDEGTSAVEMSVEAALYGVTWSQQIQSAVAKPMLVDDFLYGVILCYTIMLYYVILCYTMLYYVILCYTMLYYVILCYTIQYFGNYHNPFPLPFLASADWTNMICKPVIRNCEKNCSAVHCSWALPSAFASNRQVVLTMLMHHFCPHSTIAKQGWRWASATSIPTSFLQAHASAACMTHECHVFPNYCCATHSLEPFLGAVFYTFFATGESPSKFTTISWHRACHWRWVDNSALSAVCCIFGHCQDIHIYNINITIVVGAPYPHSSIIYSYGDYIP